jgi:hypothetical protein
VDLLLVVEVVGGAGLIYGIGMVIYAWRESRQAERDLQAFESCLEPELRFNSRQRPR